MFFFTFPFAFFFFGFLIYWYFRAFCIKSICFPLWRLPLLLCLKIVPHTISQKLCVYSSGAFIVYFVIQSKAGDAGKLQAFVHMSQFPGLGECFKTERFYVWNVYLRNWFKTHKLGELKLSTAFSMCTAHVTDPQSAIMSKRVSSFHILLSRPLIKGALY